MNLDDWQAQLRKGLLDIAILNLLNNSHCHGYEMTRILQQSQGLKIYEGNIYPILARLKADGLIVSYSKVSRDGPPRKYFKLTELGGKILREMDAHWRQVVKDIQNLSKGGQKWSRKTKLGRT